MFRSSQSRERRWCYPASWLWRGWFLSGSCFIPQAIFSFVIKGIQVNIKYAHFFGMESVCRFRMPECNDGNSAHCNLCLLGLRFCPASLVVRLGRSPPYRLIFCIFCSGGFCHVGQVISNPDQPNESSLTKNTKLAGRGGGHL